MKLIYFQIFLQITNDKIGLFCHCNITESHFLVFNAVLQLLTLAHTTGIFGTISEQSSQAESNYSDE